MRLTHRLSALLGGRQAPATPVGAGREAVETTPPDDGSPPSPPSPPPAPAPADPTSPGPGAVLAAPGGPGAATAAAVAADPCGPARVAVDDACALADRMNALALASLERLREARRAYDEHAGRREHAAATADPRAVRAAKDEAQATFRRARMAAGERGAIEAAAREWLREIDRVNARTREAVRLLTKEDAAEAGLLHSVERLGVEADGARIAAESAAEACRNARITLATCEERERLGAARPLDAPARLAPASVVAGAVAAAPSRPGTVDTADVPVAVGSAEGGASVAGVVPAVLPLLAGDRALQRRIAFDLAAGDAEAEVAWQVQLGALVDAITQRAIDSAALTFPEEHAFWGPYTQVQCREIAAALAALGYRFDGKGGFADGRVPGQRELSLAIGYAGLDPMRIRIWPTEAELPALFADVQVDAGRFVAEAAGELTLGEMIDLLGRRAEELSELWNAWGRVRPLLLAPA